MTVADNAGVPATHDIPHLPTGADDEPVFASPWEARAFALVVDLHRRGHFAWSEWTEQLGAEIAAAGPSDDGSTYYLLWLAAAEKLVAGKSFAAPGELGARKAALEAAQGGPAADA